MKSGKLHKFFAVALAISAIIFFLTACVMAHYKGRMHDVVKELEAIQADVEYNNSLPKRIATDLKAFVDGFTLGIFTKEGMFEEHLKAERWAQGVVRRSAELNAEYEYCCNEYSSCKSGRNWSGFILVISLVGYFVTKKEKVVTEQASS